MSPATRAEWESYEAGNRRAHDAYYGQRCDMCLDNTSNRSGRCGHCTRKHGRPE